MKNRYGMYRRTNGTYYSRDKITGQAESLSTSNPAEAQALLAARNQATAQPQLNRAMAKTYLSAKSPELTQRTWADVIERYVSSGVAESKDRKARAYRSEPFLRLLKVKLLDTEANHIFAVLEHKKSGNAAHHYLRRIHNYALHLGWLLAPVMADAAFGPPSARSTLRPSRKRNICVLWRRNRTESGSSTTSCCGKPAARNRTSPTSIGVAWTRKPTPSSSSGKNWKAGKRQG